MRFSNVRTFYHVAMNEATLLVFDLRVKLIGRSSVSLERVAFS